LPPISPNIERRDLVVPEFAKTAGPPFAHRATTYDQKAQARFSPHNPRHALHMQGAPYLHHLICSGSRPTGSKSKENLNGPGIFETFTSTVLRPCLKTHSTEADSLWS